MKLNLSKAEHQRLTTANICATFEHLSYLLDHPDQISQIPDGATVFLTTEDSWINEQNAILAEHAQTEGAILYYSPIIPTQTDEIKLTQC